MLSHSFGRPITSLAFHATGDFLAVASGHKVCTPNPCNMSEAHERLQPEGEVGNLLCSKRRGHCLTTLYPTRAEHVGSRVVTGAKNPSSRPGRLTDKTAALIDSPLIGLHFAWRCTGLCIVLCVGKKHSAEACCANTAVHVGVRACWRAASCGPQDQPIFTSCALSPARTALCPNS